jgi:hypothetical protein
MTTQNMHKQYTIYGSHVREFLSLFGEGSVIPTEELYRISSLEVWSVIDESFLECRMFNPAGDLVRSVIIEQ